MSGDNTTGPITSHLLAKALKTWAEATAPQLSGRSDLTGAFRYMLTQ